MAYRGILNEFTESIILKLVTKFSEVNERTVRFYLDEFEKYKTELEKKDPFQYANFEELEQAIDKIKGDKPRDRSNIKIDVDKNDIVAEDDNVVIYRGDSQDKCILYGQGYTFCISRRAAGNMYSSYRGGKESTFYFIYFKNKPKEDNDHIMVLDHTREGYEWTFANNNTQKVAGGWDEIVSKYKELAPFKDVLVNKKLNRGERSELNSVKDFINNPSVKKFIKFDFDMRSRVLKMSVDLDDDIFKILSKDLINEFLSIGPNLTPLQVASLNEKQKDWYLKNRRINVEQLIQSYVYSLNELDLTIDKIQILIENNLAEAERLVSVGSYDFKGLKIVKLPNNIPRKIDGDFNCTDCSLFSLEGAPIRVDGNFNCSNNNLTSLEGAPSKVNGDFNCSNNNLTSLEGAPSKVSNFYCNNNNLTSLKGAPSMVVDGYHNGWFYCNDNNLTSLEGAPSRVNGGFYCNNNSLTSLKGAPSSVGYFNCNNNNLTSLEGAPSKVNGGFYYNPQKNGKEFTKAEVLAAVEDSKRKQAKSIIRENRRFTQIELITNMCYWF